MRLEVKLTSKEEIVLSLFLEGMSNQEIADSMELSVSTIRGHFMRNIFRKFGLTDKRMKRKSRELMAMLS